MSTVSITIIVLGLIATAIFAAGFYRGLRQSIAGRDVKGSDDAGYDASDRWPSVILAVIASAAIISLVGFYPSAIYFGPFLVVLTAAANGVAFFLDKGVVDTASR
jgi:hypothetical protein